MATRDDGDAPTARRRGPKSERPAVQSVIHALDILDYLVSCSREVGVTELARVMNIHKSTVSRLLSTLNSRGYVTRNLQTKQYSLGMHLLELSRAKLDQLDLRPLARPYLEDLVRETGETAHLAIMDRDKVVYIDKVDTPQTLMMRSKVGYRIAIHCTALGKAMVAELPEDAVNALLDPASMVRFTPNTITDPDAFRQHLSSVRDRGYAIDDEEHENGIRCVAAPVKDHAGRVVGAISLSGPTLRVSRERAEALGQLVGDASRRLSLALGYLPVDRKRTTPT
mgnify:CR=1 FL=1